MAMTTYLLSKSRFLSGLQCPLRLWYQCHQPQLASEVTAAQQAIFDTGHAVGRLATALFPGGVSIENDYRYHDAAVRSTTAAMADANVPSIFEAGFLYNGTRVRVDVLERLPLNRWRLVEVKSSTSVKEVYLWDVAVQYHVLTGSGLDVPQAGILHIDNTYTYPGGQLAFDKLFHYQELTDLVEYRQPEVERILQRLKEMLDTSIPPAIAPDRHCQTPFLCEFWEHCTRDMPEYWVLNLTGISQNKLDLLAELGIDDIRDIPDDFALTELQARIRHCIIDQQVYVSAELNRELNDVDYPIHFLDFETVAPAIPRYPATRPFESIPFQFSDHILNRDGSLDHREYLCMEDKDPRHELSRRLLEILGGKGTITIYTSYEKTVMMKLARHLPKYEYALMAAIDRMKDLHQVIKKNYYNPKFNGSFSLKSVLPALLPQLNYQDLAIQEGSQASLEYLRMLEPQTQPDEKADIRQNLLTYCSQDTLAMVKIREELLKSA